MAHPEGESYRTIVSEEYRLALRDLTFNSKPIINNLTLFAAEHGNDDETARLISGILCQHLAQVQ